jgi:hypothetical protein
MKVHGTRVLSLFTFFAISLPISPILTAAEQNDVPWARLRLVQGDVRLSTGDGKHPNLPQQWQQAKSEIPIEQGFSIATGEGRAEIEFADGGQAYLAENSLLLFQQLSEQGDKLIVRMSLVTGTATYSLEPVSKQSFFLETPTDQIEIRGPDTYFSRMDSYLDGTAITPQGDKGETMIRQGFPDLRMAKGQTLFFRQGQLIPQIAATPPNLSNEWDSWVSYQMRQDAEATAAALKASGLSAPIPGLTDLSARGSFFPCEPYGTCWEPAWQDAVQTPIAASPAPNAANQGFQPQTITWRQLDWRWGACAPPTSMLISRVAHTQQELNELLQRRSQANSYALLNQGWSDMACHQGEWLYHHGHYAMVVSSKPHPHCKLQACKKVHPPVHWVKTGGKLGFVPAHPNDVKGKPPLNLKHGIFVPPAKPGEPFQRVDWDPPQKLKVLEKAPKEFQGGSAPHLAAASAPKIEAHLMQEKVSAKSPAAASPGNPRITYDYKSKQFLLAENSTGGAKSKGVPVGGITAQGGVSSFADGHSTKYEGEIARSGVATAYTGARSSGSYSGSSNSGGSRSSGSYSSGGNSSGGSSSHASSGSSSGGGGSSASSGGSASSHSAGGGRPL